MKRKLIPLLVGVLWSGAVIALVFMLIVCHLMTDSTQWFLALGLGSKDLSSEEFQDLILRNFSDTVAKCIDGHEIGANSVLLSDSDVQWLYTRRLHVDVMRRTALGLGAGCLTVLICWIVRYSRTAGKAIIVNGKGRYKSYLFVLFVIWLLSGSLIALILSIVAFCWIRASKGSLMPHDDTYAWIGVGCFCTGVIHRVVMTLIRGLHVIEPFHVFSSWLPVSGGLMNKLITQYSVRYMEGELSLPFDLYVCEVFLAIAAVFLVCGLIGTWLGRRKAKAMVRAIKRGAETGMVPSATEDR